MFCFFSVAGPAVSFHIVWTRAKRGITHAPTVKPSWGLIKVKRLCFIHCFLVPQIEVC